MEIRKSTYIGWMNKVSFNSEKSLVMSGFLRRVECVRSTIPQTKETL